MHIDHLMYQACLDSAYGSQINFDSGSIFEAGFIFLSGNTNTTLLSEFENRWQSRVFVCLSKDWETALLTAYPKMICTERYVMKLHNVDLSDLVKYKKNIPTKYRLTPFNEQAFKLHPFSHGINYTSYENFEAEGCGAVIWFGNEIVSSASSFLTHNNAVELDISTSESHRKLGLGIACCASMIMDCLQKNIEVHWDAQNIASFNMAEKLGFKLERTYRAYSFVKPNTP